MKNTIQLYFSEHYCRLQYEIISIYIEDVQTLITTFNGFFNSLDTLIKELNQNDYNVDVGISTIIYDGEMKDFIGDVKPGLYRMNGDVKIRDYTR